MIALSADLHTIQEAQAGDREGVRRFLEAIAPTVRRTCRGVLGADHADLEDTIQDSLFASAKALRGYRFDGDIHHYVTKIALRTAIAARKSAARWRRHGSLDELPTVDYSVLDEWSTSEIDLVHRILDRLSGVQGEALMLRVVWGFTVDEIATMTGVSQNTVKTRLRLGKNALRRNRGIRSLWRRWILGRSS